MNRRTTILNFVLVVINVGIMLSTVGNAQLGAPKSNVALQPTSPGFAQSGHANLSGTMRAGSFTGSGANLTNLNASQLTTGTLDDARLSANVAKKGSTNAFTADQWITGFLGIGQAFAGVNLDIRGNDPVIRLRNNADDVASRQQATWESVQFGMQTMTSSPVGVIPGNSSRSFFGFGADGRVGTLTNFFGAPAYRNLLDNGEGRGVVAHGLQVDGADLNPGNLDRGLRFGAGNSGEGVASTRGAGPNQWGLDFYTGNQRRMSITNGGNVGIGVSNPFRKLDVAGDAFFSGNATVAGTISADNLPGIAFEQADVPVGSGFVVAPGGLNTLSTVTVNVQAPGWVFLVGHCSAWAQAPPLGSQQYSISLFLEDWTSGSSEHLMRDVRLLAGGAVHGLSVMWVVPVTPGVKVYKTRLSNTSFDVDVRYYNRTLHAIYIPNAM